MRRKRIGTWRDGGRQVGESVTARMARAMDGLERILKGSGLDPPATGQTPRRKHYLFPMPASLPR